MNHTEFDKIKKWDTILFQRDEDPEFEMAAVMKAGRGVILIAGIDENDEDIKEDDVGFWRRIFPKDVLRVVCSFSAGQEELPPGHDAVSLLDEAIALLQRAKTGSVL